MPVYLGRAVVVRADREGVASGPNTTGIRVFAFLYYVAAFLVGVALELVFPTSWPSSGVRLAVTVLAGGAWLALDIAAIALFGAAGTSIWPFVPTTALVTSGPYRLTRNPQYVGIGFLYVAVAFALGVMWAFALLVVVFVIIDRHVVVREEVYLERTFGQAYRDYKARVRRWF